MIHVFIVEDDPMVAQLNSQYVEAVPGFQVTGIAARPDEAVTRILAERPDLLLLDVYMPGMTGLALLEQLRGAGSTADAIMISAANDMPSVRKALQYGAVDYIMKPFQFDRFQEALIRYAERHQLLQNHMHVKQSELDHLLRPAASAAVQELPKGLTKETLAVIWDAALSQNGADFSAEDIAFSSGVSRVSVRKYLTFLQEAGLLEADVSYGSVGRPQSRFCILPSEQSRIRHYIM